MVLACYSFNEFLEKVLAILKLTWLVLLQVPSKKEHRLCYLKFNGKVSRVPSKLTDLVHNTSPSKGSLYGSLENVVALKILA